MKTKKAVLTSTHNLCFEQKYEKKKNRFFLPKNSLFFVVKFSVYLNRHVFVMGGLCFRFHGNELFSVPREGCSFTVPWVEYLSVCIAFAVIVISAFLWIHVFLHKCLPLLKTVSGKTTLSNFLSSSEKGSAYSRREIASRGEEEEDKRIEK